MIKQTLTCEEYAEQLDQNYGFEQIIDEMYRDGGCDTNRMFKYVVASAQGDGVTLTDADSWIYDAYLYNIYQSTEKGLS